MATARAVVKVDVHLVLSENEAEYLKDLLQNGPVDEPSEVCKWRSAIFSALALAADLSTPNNR